MSIYKKLFKNIYPNGWKAYPNTTTPIKAEALQQYTDFMVGVEDYLSENPISSPQTLSDIDDVQQRTVFIHQNETLIYRRGYWTNEVVDTSFIIPEELKSDFPSVTTETYPVKVYYNSGYFKVINKFCFVTLRIKFDSYSTSIVNDWQTLLDYKFPEPRDSQYINAMAMYFDESSGFVTLQGKEHLLCRITPTGYLQFFRGLAQKGKMFSIYMTYLCK